MCEAGHGVQTSGRAREGCAGGTDPSELFLPLLQGGLEDCELSVCICIQGVCFLIRVGHFHGLQCLFLFRAPEKHGNGVALLGDSARSSCTWWERSP